MLALCVVAWRAMPNSAPAQQAATERLIQSLQSRLKVYPQDYNTYDGLGAAYIQKGRETGDVTYYELAKKALEKSLELRSNDLGATSALTHMAVVEMAEHQFEDALTWAQKALAMGAGDPAPWAIVGDALADLGEYGKASEAYSKLRDPINPQDQWSGIAYERESRMSYLRFVSGDPQGAVNLMRSAIRTALFSYMPAENIAWSQYQLGDEFFRIGDLDRAAKAYQDGLAAYPGYYRDLAGLAQVRAAQTRYQEAIELYQKAIAAIPYPEYAAALGDVYTKVRRPDEAKKQYDLVEFIGYLSAINKTLFNRELAMFYADHDLKLKQALDLAQKELQVRRDIYTWDALAWTLYKNERFQEAASAMIKALSLGTKDSMLYFHAGMIYNRLGQHEKAKDYLQRALATNPHFHIFYAELAEQTLEAISRTQ